MADEKDSQGLIEFISENKDDSTKSELVKFAINLVVSKDLTDGKKFIETMIRLGKPELIVEKAIESYNDNKKQFESIDSMLSYYFNTVNSSKQPSYFEMFRSVLTSGDRKDLGGKIRNIFVSAIEKSDYKQSETAVDLLIRDLKFDDSLSTRMDFLIQKTIELSGNSDDSFSAYIDRVYILQMADSIRNFYSKKRDEYAEEWNTRNPSPGYGAYEPVAKNSSTQVDNTVIPNAQSDKQATSSESVYKSELSQAQYENLKARTLTPVLEGMERAEQQEIDKLLNKKKEMIKVLLEKFESYKKEIQENYKNCFII